MLDKKSLFIYYNQKGQLYICSKAMKPTLKTSQSKSKT